jgi:hypothetical protein
MSSYSQAATFYFKQDATTKSQLKHPDCTPTCDHGSQTQFIVEKERNLYHIDQSAMVRFSHRRDERGKNENVNCSITNAQERLCVNSRRGASRELMSRSDVLQWWKRIFTPSTGTMKTEIAKMERFIQWEKLCALKYIS